MSSLNLNEPILEDWLIRSQSLNDREFVKVDKHRNLVFMPLFESRSTMEFFIKKEIDPHWNGENIQWTSHASALGGMDFLRCEYEVKNLVITLVESRNFIVVRVTPVNKEQFSTSNKNTYVTNLIATIVKTRSPYHNWKFVLPQNLDALWDKRLITNQDAPPIKDLNSRDDRIDIITFEYFVYFVFYKKIGQYEDFPPGDQWFSSEDRTIIRNELKKP